jgi:propanediol dehydratase large subunit
VDCGLRSVSEEAAVEVRAKAARAIQVICEALDFPKYTDEQIERVIYAHSSEQIERMSADNIKMSDEMIKRNLTIVDIIKGFAKQGESEIAEALLSLVKQRIAGDYLQTAAIFDPDLNCVSAVNYANDYAGPGSGYRIERERWDEIRTLRQVKRPEDIKVAQTCGDGFSCGLRLSIKDIGPALKGHRPDEIVIGISPAFGKALNQTLSGLHVGEALYEIMAGIEEEECHTRVIRIENSIDLGLIGSRAAKVSGSGVGIGIQSKGTTIIHQKDLPPLDNLELFPMALLIDLKMYRAIGRNAACYAKGKQPPTIPTKWDQSITHKRARAEPLVVILQHIEAEHVVEDKLSTELELMFSHLEDDEQ